MPLFTGSNGTRSDTDSFFWRIENHLLRDGGFGLIEGDPGSGKSVTMRQLAHRLERVDGLTVAALSHTSSRLGDFYREYGRAVRRQPVAA